MIHPRSATLSRFDTGILSEGRRRRVAAHLARCARCRQVLLELRALGEVARDLPAPAPPAGAWERIRLRRAAGERIILPTVDAAPPRRAVPRIALAVAGMVAALAIPAALLRAPALEAEASELTFSPARPAPGERVSVEYRATSRFEPDGRLVLRGRVFGSGWTLERRHREVATLERVDDRTFRGSFRLPDSAVYAVFAVESPGGERVDHDPRAWELLVHRPDGSPTLIALRRKLDHQREWSADLALETAREMVRHYPDSLMSWQTLYFQASARATDAERDSLARAHRARLDRMEPRLTADPDPQRMATMVFYAGAVGDTARARRWTDRLIAAHPAHPAAVQQRVFRLSRGAGGDADALLVALEALWEEAGPVSSQLPSTAFQAAQRSGDPAAILRWGDRFERTEPAVAPYVAAVTSGVPALRAEAIDRARRQNLRLDELRGEDRPLAYTAADQRRENRSVKGDFLGRLGRMLLAEGEVAEGLAALEEAVETGWDVGLFRTIAETKLERSDTAGALPLLARAAADPGASAGFADSVRIRLGAAFRPARWEEMVAAGRRELEAYVADQASSRPVRGEVRLTDPDGREHEIDLRTGGPVVVAFWSRYCAPSAAQLGLLQEIADDLARRGVSVLAVTDEPPSAELRGFLSGKGYSFPVYHDVERSARRAFDNAVTPRYLVVDGAGRIRFESYLPDDLVRQVEFLRARGAAAGAAGGG